MALNLKKGEKLSLTKTVQGLEEIVVGLGWDARQTAGASFDLDAVAFLATASGKCRTEKDVVFYKMDKDAQGLLRTPCGSVQHTGDNKDGGGDGDDEQINVFLTKVPADIQRIVFTVTIYEYLKRKQNFGMVSNAFIRIVNKKDGKEICRFDLSEDYSTESAMEFGAVYRKDGGWSFDAIGQGYSGGLAAMCGRYGIDADDENK